MTPQQVVAHFLYEAFFDHAATCEQWHKCPHIKGEQEEAFRLAGVLLDVTLPDHGLAVIPTDGAA